MEGLMDKIGSTVKGRLAEAKLDHEENEIRKFILRKFASDGAAPSPDMIMKELGISSLDRVNRAIEKMERADILSRKGDRIINAYPFSALKTRNIVIFEDGRKVYALCSTDAFGIHFMLNEAVTILSGCPECEQEMRIKVKNGRIESVNPEGIVEFASERERGKCIAETCCPFINFFCSGECLAGWREKNPEFGKGETYTIYESLDHGRNIFGEFLG